MLGGAMSGNPSGSGAQTGLGGLLGSLSGLLGGGSNSGQAGNVLNSGLNELLDKFKQNGHGETAQSWVDPGPNKDISPPQLKQAIGADVLEDLEQRTGLSQQELLTRLSRELPSAVDKYTPDGRLPQP